ncbi:hypothetical protein HY469_04970 [Candidatus Roizmanbacteria bacterium]|nr:hypothetical protein [Candidatus Roizmanbacteria bacterium]
MQPKESTTPNLATSEDALDVLVTSLGNIILQPMSSLSNDGKYITIYNERGKMIQQLDATTIPSSGLTQQPFGHES